MRFCIVGAGAIGGFVGAKLSLSGAEVTYIARGRNLEAINAQGMRIVHRDGREEVAARVRATDDYARAGPCDVVILAVKAHQLSAVAPKLGALLAPDTVLLPMQNGIPFWYFHEHGGALAGRTIETVDPGGVAGQSIPARHILGVVIYSANQLLAPGRVLHNEMDRFPIGELDGSVTERAQRVSAAFVAAGLQCPVLEDIRSEVWLKLWGNQAFNPISALTRATLTGICNDADGRALVAQMMREAHAVGTKLGATFAASVDERIARAARVGGHKTSMLQDVEAGRALELDALVGSVVELGELTGTPTPTIRAVYQAAKLLERTLAAGRATARPETTLTG